MKYLIKLEQGDFEQTFKVSELDVLEEELDEILSEDFVNQAIERFADMQKALWKSMPWHGINLKKDYIYFICLLISC